MSETTETKSGYSRRDFLKIVGVGSGLAAVGCTQRPVEKIIPYVVPPDEVIPGVAAWYASTCGECSAGCGTLVRTREGRVVKVEGNPRHPINKGGLCARGQSAVQGHYDPDRVREPQMRTASKAFEPISWAKGIELLAAELSSLPSDKEAVLLTRPLTGTIKRLIGEIQAKVPRFTHVEYELLNTDAVDLAAAQTFGPGIRTEFDFSQADVLVNFGADFLETWGSTVAYARQWGERRRPDEQGNISYFVHIEPRLSVTAGNADYWVMNKPGSESMLLRALLKAVADHSGGRNGSGAARAAASALTQGVDIAAAEREAGVSEGTITAIAQRLLSAQRSLVIAGGAALSGLDGVASAVAANLLNALLGNVGRSVKLVARPSGSTAKAGYDAVLALTERMAAGQVQVLISYGTNPAFTLPAAVGFQKSLSSVKLVVSASSHMDETAALATLVLPSSTSFESWEDGEAAPGVYTLTQPAMSPLYQTQGFGDTLLSLASKLGIELGEVGSYHDYLRAAWRARVGEPGFEERWYNFVEQGGDFAAATDSSVSAPVAASASAVKFSDTPVAENDLLLQAFPTAIFADGSTANRPFMQEIPEPMTTVVWGSWCEMHPRTAQRLGVAQGDLIDLRTAHGVLQVPVFLREHIHEQVLAIPIGQGHYNYGRYATGVGVNPLAILGPESANGLMSLRAADVRVAKSPWSEKLVVLQGSDKQEGRGIARLKKVAAGSHEDVHEDEHGDHGGHGGHGHGPTPQMYQQMDHPLYRWGMAIDLSTCTGCSACVVACYAENNVPVVGKQLCAEGREMSWLRIERYADGPPERPVTAYVPMLCQHCSNAPCEPVCPVYATYHSDEGLNSMVYNRCVGTRYCSNNCSYKVRRFNWFHYKWPEPLTWSLNPDVTVREVGVMEKCTFCVQRIREVQNRAKNEGRPVQDGEIQPACAASCPTKSIVFGNLKDRRSLVATQSKSERAYRVLDDHLNTQPAVSYLSRVVRTDGLGRV